MLVFVQCLAFLAIWLTYGYDTRHSGCIIATISVNLALLFFSTAHFCETILPYLVDLTTDTRANATEVLHTAFRIAAQCIALLSACSWSLILNGFLSALLLATVLIWSLRFREARVLDPGITV